MKFAPSCALVLGLWSACGADGPPGPAGMPGPAGPPGPMGTMGLPGNGSMFSCDPGKTFCDGAKIWSCTKSGTDAVLTKDCATDLGDKSVVNPLSCFTSSCTPSGIGINGGPACCRKTKYVCVASFDTDPSLDFSTYGGDPHGDGCLVGGGAGCYQTGVPVFGVNRTLGTTHVQVSLWFFSDKIKVGQVVSLADLSALPMACNGMQQVSVAAGGQTCTNWSGKVTWTADNPSFEVSLDLACQDMDKSGMKLKGTFKGDV